MTCSHHKTDRVIYKTEWPCKWSTERRERFGRVMLSLGVGPNFLTPMANEVERLAAESFYEVTEEDLIRYMTESRAIAMRTAALEETRTDLLSWSRQLTKPLMFSPAARKDVAVFKLVVLILLGCLILPITLIFRMGVGFLHWQNRRKLHPSFAGWLKANGRRKVLT